MNYSKYATNLKIYTILFLSILISTFLWSKINLPYSNTHNVEGIYASLEYSAHNDVVRYIFFIGFPILTFFLSLFHFKKKEFVDFKDLLTVNYEYPAFNKSTKKILIFSFIIFVTYILVEFLSLNMPGMKIDYLHDGDYLTAAMNYFLTSNIWSSFAVHGTSMSIYPNLMWKIFDVESVGAYRLFPFFLIILVKLFSLYFVFQLTKIASLNDSFKIIFFIISSFVILSMSDYGGLSNGGYNPISYRDLYLIFFLILLFNIIILEKSNYLNIFLISIIPSFTILLHTDIGIYLNFTLIFLMIYLYIIKNKKNWFIILVISSFWFLVLAYMGLDEFKSFFKNILILTSSIDYLHGIPYPEPFFDISESKHGTRGTKGLILQLIAGLLITYKVFIKDSKIENKKKIFFIFLLILSVVFYRTALGRSDSYHMKMSSDLPILIISFFTIEYLLINIEKFLKSFQDKVVNYTFLIIFIFAILYEGNTTLNYKNIKDIKNRYTEFVKLEDSFFMNNDTIDLINYLKKVTKKEKCIQNFTYDNAIPFFLKKISCTPYYSSWLASPPVMQEDYIKRLKIANPNYIIYKNDKFILERFTHERLKLVDNYINQNYNFHIKVNDFSIYKLKNLIKIKS